MKTSKHKFWGYLATTGGPVCICSSDNLVEWSGAKNESGLYWQAINDIGSDYFQPFLNVFYLFNTETGNFVLFRCKRELIVAEIIYIEHDFAMPWEGIEFTINELEEIKIELKGIISVFDSSLTLKSSEEESLRAIDDAPNWNAAFIKGDFSVVRHVSFENNSISISGILLS